MSRTDREVDTLIGGRVRDARLAAGMTQAQLGTKVGLHQTAIARVEGGQQSLPAHALIRVAEALDLPAFALVDLGDPQRPVTRAELDAVNQRIWRLEDYAKRLAGLLGSAGAVLDMAKLLEKEVLNPAPKEIKT